MKHVRLYRPKGIWSFGGSRLGQSKLQEFGRGSNPPNNFYRKVGTFSILYVAALVMTALQSLGSTLNHHFPISKKVLLKIGGVAACLLSGVLQAKVRMLQGLRSPQPNFVVGFGRHHHRIGCQQKNMLSSFHWPLSQFLLLSPTILPGGRTEGCASDPGGAFPGCIFATQQHTMVVRGWGHHTLPCELQSASGQLFRVFLCSFSWSSDDMR